MVLLCLVKTKIGTLNNLTRPKKLIKLKMISKISEVNYYIKTNKFKNSNYCWKKIL